MRWISTILAAVSCILLVVTLFYYVRSYSRFEGYLRYTEGGEVAVARASVRNRSVEEEIAGRSAGWFSYRGQLTWVSTANPIRPANEVEAWNVPVAQPTMTGPMMLVYGAREHGGLRWGSVVSKYDLLDPGRVIAWRLPYRFFTVPYWVLLVAFAVWPYVWVRKYLSEERGEVVPVAPKDAAGKPAR